MPRGAWNFSLAMGSAESRYGNIRPMQHWDLLAVDAARGTRDPYVVHQDDGARAVLVVLAPGQALGEHQVKENAWVSVVEGTVQVVVRRRAARARRRRADAVRARRAPLGLERGRRADPDAALAVARRGPLPRAD